MKLSEHFTKEELTYSATAIKYEVVNTPTEIHLRTLVHTCQYFLEPLRKLLNQKFVNNIYTGKIVQKVIIEITSGYRSKTVNTLLRKEGHNPSDTSQHCTGEAVDFVVWVIFTDGTRRKYPYTETYKAIKTWTKEGKLSVDQLIQEKSGKFMWVHASYKAGGSKVNRNQFMIYKNGKYIND